MDAKTVMKFVHDQPRWDQLPTPVLNQIAALVGYRKKQLITRGCQSWRLSILAGVRSIRIRDTNLYILQHLQAVQHLIVDTLYYTIGSSRTNGMRNTWSLANTGMMNRRKTLELRRPTTGETLFQQLADWLAQPLPNCSSISSKPDLHSLRSLALINAGDISEALPKILGAGKRDSPALQADFPCAHIQETAAVLKDCFPLQHLHYLSISRCSFRAGPERFDVLRDLPSLRTLRLVDCELQQLPPAVPCCSKLTFLDLTRNQLQQLPEEVLKLQHLQSLKLTGNPDLHTLGDGFSHLTSLTYLDLPKCPGIHRAQTVEASSVGPPAVNAQGAPQPGSDLSYTLQLLPFTQLAALGNIRWLDLSYNRTLCVLPPSISHLTQLIELHVRMCSICSIPDELWACTSLKHLSLGYNLLEMLPDDISKLVNLEVLDFGGNKSLWRLSPAFLSLKALAQFEIASALYEREEHLLLAKELMKKRVSVIWDQGPYEDEMKFLQESWT